MSTIDRISTVSDCEAIYNSSGLSGLLQLYRGDGSARNLEHFIDFKPVIDKFIQTGAGNDRLNIPYAVQKIILAAAVQFGQDIVQKQYGGIVCHFF